MNSRERLIKTLNHEEPDKAVVDLGSSVVTGISAGALNKLRKRLGLQERPVKVYEPVQVLGEVDEDVRQALGIDVVGIDNDVTMFGFKNEEWKEWTLFDGTKALVSTGFKPATNDSGDLLLYPQGDLSAKPCAKMPNGGRYFDMIVRQQKLDEGELDARSDFADDFHVFSESELRVIQDKADYYFKNTQYGLNGGGFLSGFGDVSVLPGPTYKEPRGIRNVEDWLVAHYTDPDYIKEVYELQLETVIENLKLYKEAVGDKIQVIQLSGTDFGTQRGEFISPDMYREFYKPYHKRVNEWVHKNTKWKTFYHSCGSIVNILDDLADAGVDVLNPVQCSAAGMDPQMLKDKYGDKFVFWGAGVDTQNTLPFGTPEDVKREVKERLRIFSKGGGFVFNAIHNIQADTPVENIVAMFEAVKEFNKE